MTTDSIRAALMTIAAEIERHNYTSAADKVAALVNALPPATDALAQHMDVPGRHAPDQADADPATRGPIGGGR